jgi:hypothetical protein
MDSLPSSRDNKAMDVLVNSRVQVENVLALAKEFGISLPFAREWSLTILCNPSLP